MNRQLVSHRVLYVSNDGMTDPLGRSQVLPYLAGLSARGYTIHLISCEKPARFRQHAATIERICAEAGIQWHPVPYEDRLPIVSATVNAVKMGRVAERLHRRHRFELVHCRSDVAALVGLRFKRRHRVPFLYDMRGFWPDERVDGGTWRLANPVHALVYRFFKKKQAAYLREADQIVSLTEEGKRVVAARSDRGEHAPPVTVIPCCADFDHFALVDDGMRQASRSALGIGPASKVLTYLGSVGTWYMLGEMLDFFRVFEGRHADARFLFITPSDPKQIADVARARGIGADRLIVRSASREEVPALVAAADVGIFFIQPCFSKKASCPTKLGELLACGLPIVTNSGVGDVKQIIEETGAGVAIDAFDRPAYEDAVQRLDHLDMTQGAWREHARQWFDLELGIDRYDRVYRSILSGHALEKLD